MPRTPRLIAGLAAADGALTVVTAVDFARAGDPAGFRAIAGFLVVFAVLALITFAGGGLVQLDARSARTGLILVAGLAFVDGLANAVFIVSSLGGSGVPANLHWATTSSSAFLMILATVELASSEIPKPYHEIPLSGDPRAPAPRLTPWPVSLILGATTVGGLATLLGLGRDDFDPDGPFRGPATGPAWITVVCLVLFALGAGAVAATALARAKGKGSSRLLAPIALIVLTPASVAAIWSGVRDARRGATLGLTSYAPVPWSGRFWISLAVSLASALALGAALARDNPAGDLMPKRLPS